MDTLFPLPEPVKKKSPPPRVKEGERFDWRPYAWLHKAISGGVFPIQRWVKPLLIVETDNGKLRTLKGWAMYLSQTEARYVSAHSFARSAGQWIRQAPSCPDAIFQSKEAVDEYFGGETKIEVPPHIVSQGMSAIKKWLDGLGGG